MNRQVIFRIGVCFLLLIAVGVPLASAATEIIPLPVQQQNLSADNPALIGALKAHAADLAGFQKARMDGVITYITNISGGSGGVDLQMIEEDYLATATSIPLMGTVDEIDAARSDMGDLTRKFSEETKAQMQIFNGSTGDMRSSINDSIASVGKSVDGVKGYAWLAGDAARLQVFDLAVMKQNELLASLSSQGIDVSAAQSVSDQIAARRTVLVDALEKHDDAALITTNTVIKSLNQQFRNDIATYRTKLEIQLTVAALNLGL
ncbi:MAG: hypothetical protein ABSB80_10720 [Methanoregula sp.]|jgi:hypothetical protein|uniref:hypothetical protein n=1 Tax=Methanoregula sp. TaxID=2052170 RepID=UPI003D0D1C25